MSPQNDFGPITRINAEAVGEPGKRSFRLLIDSGDSSAMVWMEKEQLFEMGVTIRRLLAMVADSRGSSSPPQPTIASASLEFKVGRRSVGHDPESGYLIIEAHDVEGAPGAAADLRVWPTPDQMEALAEEAFAVCSAGRPLCPLCGGPIDPTGHFCVRLNGHGDSTAFQQE